MDRTQNVGKDQGEERDKTENGGGRSERLKRKRRYYQVQTMNVYMFENKIILLPTSNFVQVAF